MKKILFYLMIIISSNNLECLFERDKAAAQLQKNAWAPAQELLQPLLAENPTDSTLLYDLGVAAYKKQEHDQAAAYFSAAAEYATDQSLKEQSFFNYGNALVQQKKLKEALKAYEKAMELSPANERARHNWEVVKKMLEQQEQDNKKNDQSSNDQSEQDNDQQKDDKNQAQNDQKNEQNNNNQKSERNNSENNERDEQSDGQQEQKENTEQQQKDRDLQQNKDQKDEREEGEREQESQQDKNSQNDSRENFGNEPQNQNGNDKPDEHDISPESTNDTQESLEENTQEEEKEQALARGGYGDKEDIFKELDARLAQLLDVQEKKDADLSKQIIKMHVDQQLAGQDGQNRW